MVTFLLFANHLTTLLKHIRPVLTPDMARAVAASLVQTRLDFANPVLLGISSSNINKLQRVQNCLARVILLDQSSPSTSLLSQLHWLPVPKRIEFKIATLTYQSVTFGQPHALLTLVRALIVSKVDYCNSVLAGMSRHLHDRLQSVLSLFRCVLTPLMEAHCTPYWYIYHPTLWVRFQREYHPLGFPAVYFPCEKLSRFGGCG